MTGWGTPQTERIEMEIGDVFVQGKDQQTARDLLTASRELDLEDLVVRTTNHGFIVPGEVWDRAQQNRSQATGQDF